VLAAGAGGTPPVGGAGGSGNAGGSSGGAAAGGVSGSGGGSAQAGAGGAVNLPPGVSALFPIPNSTGVCMDAPLSITFSSKPTLGATGKISIFAQASPNTALDTVDLATQKISDTIAGQLRNEVRPVFVDGNQVVVYFHQRKLSANTRYFITVSATAFLDSAKASVGAVSGSSAWSFTTGPSATASASLVVDRTGSGPLCTVQGAFDVIPANNSAARTITVKKGMYHEILFLKAKQNITLKGEDRAGTVIAYPNNEQLNGGTAARAMFSANGTTGLVIENLTLYNTTPQDGTQAEALKVQADQVILRSANFKSLQDTLLLTGRVYVANSYIEGNVDFVWGDGITYFDQCEIKTVGRAGAIVQSRNAAGYGYVFVDSKLTSDAGITGQVLARIDATEYPQSHVAFINCQMSSAISAKGWTITPAGTSQTGSLRFWEYQSTDANGSPLNVSGRDPASKQITAAQAAAMRDKATVFGGWNPQ
jgi:pectin methylesterase-like acyl-CoA thioesterase